MTTDNLTARSWDEVAKRFRTVTVPYCRKMGWIRFPEPQEKPVAKRGRILKVRAPKSPIEHLADLVGELKASLEHEDRARAGKASPADCPTSEGTQATALAGTAKSDAGPPTPSPKSSGAGVQTQTG